MTVRKRFPLVKRAAETIGTGAFLIPGKASTATSATAGSATGLPALPATYMTIVVNNTTYKIPLYLP